MNINVLSQISVGVELLSQRHQQQDWSNPKTTLWFLMFSNASSLLSAGRVVEISKQHILIFHALIMADTSFNLWYEPKPFRNCQPEFASKVLVGG